MSRVAVMGSEAAVRTGAQIWKAVCWFRKDVLKGMEQRKCKFLQLKQEVVLEESSEDTMLPQGEVCVNTIGCARGRGTLVV